MYAILKLAKDNKITIKTASKPNKKHIVLGPFENSKEAFQAAGNYIQNYYQITNNNNPS